MFIGSVAAGHRTVDLMALVRISLQNYLDVWPLEHPDHIREYRVEERRDRADRKQHRQATHRRTSPAKM